MEYIKTEIAGLWIVEPKILTDARGYFVETYKKEEFEHHIGKFDFIQDNESKSSFGVLRGLHYQEGDTAQAKLVRVVQGTVWDIAVDIRKGSSTFGQYVAVELSDENKRQFFISRGFAHGFLVLSETAVFSYKVDNRYSPSTERTLNCFDPDLNIQWPLDKSQLFLSDKDKTGKYLKEIATL
ncbi:dTDP-4-dehydrorhamnose 3,5-epimerase [Bacteroidia bacterium]|nr:dTDP-4-dehydrorhamnose 3,5-epimerase [Bacteroidia bacterium]GHV71523.1 dTDP-4-dehydrorhamnose 3,5-epimerase [Bacteroidia bacterium]